MSDSSRVQFYELEETVFGVTDASPLNELRFTGESLGHDLNTVESEEIRDDRQVTDIITVGQEETGDINFELSYGSYDNLLPGALYSGDWPTELTVTASDISAALADNSFNSAAAAMPAFVPGQWVEVRGFTDAAGELNGYHQVVSRTTAKLIVTTSITADEAASNSITIKGTMIRNGVTRKTYTLEKHFADITQFQSFTGSTIGTMSLDVSSNSVLKGAFGITGIASALTQATVGTGAAVAANTNAVMNASSNVGTLREGGAALTATTFIQSLSIALDNKLRPLDAVSSIAHIDIGAGTLNITGTMKVYFKTNALFDKYLAGTETSLSFSVEDAAGNAYIISIPALKFTDGNIVAGSKDTDVLADMTWQAKRHITQDNMIQVDRFAA